VRWIRKLPFAPRALHGIAVLLAAAVLAIAVHGFLDSLWFVGRTFPGFVFTQIGLGSAPAGAPVGKGGGVVVIGSFALPGWSSVAVSDIYGNEILAVDGEPVRSSADVFGKIEAAPAGTVFHYLLRGWGGAERTVALPTQAFTLRDWLLLFGPYLSIGIAFAGAGILLWAISPDRPLARALLSCGLAEALLMLPILDFFGDGTAARMPLHLYWVGQAFLPAAALHLMLFFPERHRLARARVLGYLVSLAIFAGYEWLYFRAGDPFPTYWWVMAVNSAYLGLVMVLAIVRLIVASFSTRSMLARQRIRVVALGTLFGFGPAASLQLLWVLFPEDLPWSQGVLSFSPLLFPLSVFYATYQHDLFQIDATIRRWLVYLLASGVVAFSYVALATVFDLWLRPQFLTESIAFTILFTFAVLLLFYPLRTRLQAFVDRVFFGTAYDGATVLAEMGKELSGARSLDGVAAIVRRGVAATVSAERTLLFYRRGDAAAPPREIGGERSLPESLCRALGVGRVISSQDAPEMFGQTGSHRAARLAMERLDIKVVVPMTMEGQLAGALALGAKGSGAFYTGDDVQFLRALAQETAIALENARSYEAVRSLATELEERVRERTAQLASANQQLAQSNRELSHAYAELQEAQVKLLQTEKLASLGRLAAGVAHEINNPVSFISSNIPPLRSRIAELEGVIPPERSSLLDEIREFVDIMGRGAERTTRIVGDLRTFSRLGQAPFKPVDLHEGIEVSLRLLEPRWRGRVEIHRDYADLPEVECDAGQVNQVVMNLLANAFDAIPGEGNVWLRTWCDADTVGFAVRDDGVGIPPDRLEQVFEPFFTTKEIGRGTGLGLAIVHGIVTAHRGRIEVSSRPGEGTTFQVWLPRHGRPAEAGAEPVERARSRG
jgi:signal transduction histidine kinase